MGESQLDPGFEATEEGYGHMPQPEEGADASPDTTKEEPVEAEAKAEEPEAGQESEAESPPADEEDVEEKTNPMQDRVNKLTKRFRSLERESSQLLGEKDKEIQELRKQLAERPADTPKTLADFDYDEGKFQAYIFEEAEKRAENVVNRRFAEVPEPTQSNETAVKFANAETKFAAEHDDYHDVVYDPTLRVTPDMRDYMQASDNGPEIAYHLGKNPDIAMDIAGMPPALAGRALGKIEDGLVKARTKPKDVSKAPPPPKTDLGGGTAAPSVRTTDPASDKLSDDEWFAKEEARQAKKRG